MEQANLVWIVYQNDGVPFQCPLFASYILNHYNDVIISAKASQITGVLIVCSTVCSAADQWRQSSASLHFARGIHRSPGDSPHKGPVTWKMIPLDDVIMSQQNNDTMFGTTTYQHMVEDSSILLLLLDYENRLTSSDYSPIEFDLIPLQNIHGAENTDLSW